MNINYDWAKTFVIIKSIQTNVFYMIILNFFIFYFDPLFLQDENAVYEP